MSTFQNICISDRIFQAKWKEGCLLILRIFLDTTIIFLEIKITDLNKHTLAQCATTPIWFSSCTKLCKMFLQMSLTLGLQLSTSSAVYVFGLIVVEKCQHQCLTAYSNVAKKWPIITCNFSELLNFAY